MRNCFIPHCDAYCKQHSIEKRMMFMPPKDEEIFKEWKDKLFNKRPFKYTDKVCERHFTKEAILTHWDHVIQGQRVQLKRDKPKLKEKAIPTLNLPDFQDASLCRENDSSTKQKHRRIKSKGQADNLCDRNEEPTKRRKKTIEHETTNNGHIDATEFVPEINSDQETEKDDARINENEDNPEKLASFECICDDIFEVVLPSTLWGIHRDPDNKFIAFSMFDVSTMSNSKLLYVSDKFEVKIVILNTIISEQNLNEISIEILSNLLNDLEEYRLCTDHRAPKCELLALSDSNYCSNCKQRL